jgi:hypothetical protein
MSSCVIEDVTGQHSPSDFYNDLGDILIKHEGNTDKFLSTVFDFLKNKSNFFKQADPRKKVLDALRQVAGDDAKMKGGFFGAKPVPSPKPSAPEEKPVNVQILLGYCLETSA